MDQPKPNNPARRFRIGRFGLRAFLIAVTAICCACGWLAYELNGIKLRHNFLKEAENGGGQYVSSSGPFSNPRTKKMIPLWRRWLGDEAVAILELPDYGPASDVQKGKELFPEADVHRRYPY